MRSRRWTSLHRQPYNAARVLLQRANLNFVLMYAITNAYGSISYFFSQPFVDPSHHLWKQEDWMKTSQHQSLSGCTYPFSFSCCWQICATDYMECNGGVGCVILCQNVFSWSYFTIFSWKYPTLHCNLYSLLFHNSFSVIGRSVISICTFVQTSLIICVSETLTVLCLIAE